MTSKKWLSAIVGIGSLLLVSFQISCGDTEEELETKKSPIIFGTSDNPRNVSQARGQAERAQERLVNKSVRDEKLYRLYKTTVLSRAAGHTRTLKYRTDILCKPRGTPLADNPTNGSGFQTSATRMVTAQHVVSAPARKKHGKETILVTFEGEYQKADHPVSGSDPPRSTGEFVPDGPNNNSLHHLDDNTGPGEGKMDVREENPYLANRLFSLGLFEWARKKEQDTRNVLREHWPMEWDKVPDPNNRSQFDFQPRASGDFGRDVAILKAMDRRDELFSDDAVAPTPASGGFWLGAPGMLFNQKSLSPILGGDRKIQKRRPVDRKTDLYSTHFTIWPSDDDFDLDQAKEPIKSDVRAPLVSNPGFSDGNPVEVKDSELCILKNGVPTEIENFTLKDLVPTSLDVHKGSSGGALLHRDARRLPERLDNEREEWSIAATGIASRVEHPFDANPKPRDNWGENIEVVKEDFPDDAKAYYTAATREIAEWTERGKDWHCENQSNAKSNCKSKKEDPFHPVPSQPQGKTGKLNCVDESEEGVCREVEIEWAESPNYPDYDGKTGTPVHMEDEKYTDEDGFTEEGWEYKQKCYHIGNYEDTKKPTDWARWEVTGAGLMAGVMGSPSSVTLSESEPVWLADFSSICAPYSSASWARNWRFLHLGFKTAVDWLDGEHHAGKNFDPRWNNIITGVTGPLSEVLTKVLEVRFDKLGRDTENRYVRPPSFKMCPPNTYLWGIGYKADPAENGDIMRGIKYLKCHKPDGVPNRKPEQVGHKAYTSPRFSDGKLNPDNYEYQIRTRNFSLEQRLGHPNPDGDLVEVNCADLEEVSGDEMFAAGFHIRRGPGNKIREFHLGCLPSPAESSAEAQQAEIAKLCARAPLPIGSLSQPFATGRCVRLRGLNPIRRISKTKFLAKVGVSGGPSAVSVMLDRPANPKSVKGGVGRVVGSASYKIPGGGKQTVPEIRMLKR